MAQTLGAATSEFEKRDRCAGLPHRPRVLLGKMGLDGHDRGVKVIARALRDSGIHVIYSGLWQTPRSLAISARDEDCDVIAASMMSNSHLKLGPMLVGALGDLGRPDIPVYMGGILPKEDTQKLMDAGVGALFPTGTGLQEIVDAVCGAVTARAAKIAATGDPVAQLARDLSLVHASGRPETDGAKSVPARSDAARKRPARLIGVTGSPGAGKSTLVAQLVGEFSRRQSASGTNERCAVVAFDPMSPITGGALLGDRLRVDFNTMGDSVFYRSFAIRGEDYASLDEILELIGGVEHTDGSRYSTVFVETVGAGQNETQIREHVDSTMVVLTPGMGDAVQMDKAGILEIADLFVCNKADHPGENELMRDLREIAGRRPVFETVATRGRGVPELLDALTD